MLEIKLLVNKYLGIIPFLFFVFFLIIGVVIYKDYGFSWDEKFQRDLGLVSVKYVFRNNRSLFDFSDKAYGPAFVIILIIIEKIWNPTGNIEVNPNYFIRHLFTFFSFYLGSIFFYLLLKRIYKSKGLALIGSLFLILSPRIFAHSFYNPKDIPFLSFFIISVYTFIKYLDDNKISNAIFHGIICGFLIAIRIFGIIVPLFTLLFYIFNLIKKKNKKYYFLSSLHYLIVLIFSTVIFWPYLWANPLFNFIYVFKKMSAYPFGGSVLYLGKEIAAQSIPWHYIPVWIIITTPILYSFLFLIGFFAFIFNILTTKIRLFFSQRNKFILLLWFFVPLVLLIVFKAVVYDEWRHLFFIYPALIAMSINGLQAIHQLIQKFQKYYLVKIIKIIVFLIILACLSNILAFMFKHHPYQNLYFNQLAGKDFQQIKMNFEFDYWGLSYRKALEYILQNDKNNKIKIYVNTAAGEYSSLILPKQQRERLIYVNDPQKAQYFISNYRWHKENYPYSEEFFSIKINNTKIIVVYKL